MLDTAPVSRILMSSAVASFNDATSGLDNFFAALRSSPANGDRATRGVTSLAEVVKGVGGAKQALQSARAAVGGEAPDLAFTSAAAFAKAEAGVDELGLFATRMLDSKGKAMVDPTMQLRRVDDTRQQLRTLSLAVQRATVSDLGAAPYHLRLASVSAGGTREALRDFLRIVQAELDPKIRQREGRLLLQRAANRMQIVRTDIRQARRITEGVEDEATRLLSSADTAALRLQSMVDSMLRPPSRHETVQVHSKDLTAAVDDHIASLDAVTDYVRGAKASKTPVGESLRPVFSHA